jgi:hypothetical protein
MSGQPAEARRPRAVKVTSGHSSVAFFVVILVTAILCISGQVRPESTLLDGKTFIAKTGMMGEEAVHEDILVFRSGKFYSEACSPWGFDGGDYTTRIEGDTVYFEAITLSPKHGKMVWKGQVRGDAIDGTYIWTKERWYWKNARQDKWFKGSLKK